MIWTAQAVADLVGGRLSGPGDVVLRRVRALAHAEADALAMCTGRKFAADLQASRAGAVLVNTETADLAGPATRILVADPARAMLAAIHALHPDARVPAGVAFSAVVASDAHVSDSAAVGAHTVIGARARIGARAVIGAHVIVGDDVVVGDDARVDNHVTLYDGVVLGNRVRCKAGAVIGGPGFGYMQTDTGHVRIPHVGGCIVGDDVDIGSNTCIDRGSLDDTRIGRGTKIDNQVHIAHNVQIGEDCLIMACVGIAGSVRLGNRVILAGQAGCVDHIVLGDDVKVGAKSAVMSDFPAGSVITGYPARPHREFLRGVSTMYRLGPYGAALQTLAQEADK